MASHWTPHGTATENLGWGSCRFDTLQLVYYTNNTSTSVALEKAGQWVRPSSSYCDVVSGTVQVTQGDGSVPTWRKLTFANPVSHPSSWTAWWNQGQSTYYKYGQAVISSTTAGPGSPDAQQAGWNVIFWPSGSIEDETLN